MPAWQLGVKPDTSGDTDVDVELGTHPRTGLGIFFKRRKFGVNVGPFYQHGKLSCSAGAEAKQEGFTPTLQHAMLCLDKHAQQLGVMRRTVSKLVCGRFAALVSSHAVVYAG